MRLITRSSFCLCLILLHLLPVSAPAVPAITCHCFTERSYDPAHPTLADPYLLATTQNSFFSAAFATDKKGIVLKKQKGASSDDLWIAFWIAGRGGTAAPDAILQARKGKDTWQEVIATMGLSDRKLGNRFAAALKAKSSPARLAEAVVDDLLGHYRLLNETELATLRKAGGTNQELIIAALIAARTGQPATRLFREVKNGSTSWGALLEKAKLSPEGIQKEFDSLVSR